MKMEFTDEMVSQEHRFAMGTATAGWDPSAPACPADDGAAKLSTPPAKRYLSIPTTNGTMHHEEYYEITEEEFKAFAKDVSKGAEFARAARGREREALLIVKPGRERGWAQ